MTEIVLCLSNVRPVEGGLEHLFPEKNPRWRFAQFRDSAAKAAVADSGDTLLIAAAPLGERIGAASQTANGSGLMPSNTPAPGTTSSIARPRPSTRGPTARSRG